jgi:hypothetical protein
MLRGYEGLGVDACPGGTRFVRAKPVGAVRAGFALAEACLREAGLCYWVAFAGSVAARCVRIKAATRSYSAGLVQTS